MCGHMLEQSGKEHHTTYRLISYMCTLVVMSELVAAAVAAAVWICSLPCEHAFSLQLRLLGDSALTRDTHKKACVMHTICIQHDALTPGTLSHQECANLDLCCTVGVC